MNADEIAILRKTLRPHYAAEAVALRLLTALEQSQVALAEVEMLFEQEKARARQLSVSLLDLQTNNDALRARLEAAQGALRAHDELCAQLPDKIVKRLSKGQRKKLLTPELIAAVIGVDDETLAALHDHLHELMTLRGDRRDRAAIAEMEGK